MVSLVDERERERERGGRERERERRGERENLRQIERFDLEVTLGKIR